MASNFYKILITKKVGKKWQNILYQKEITDDEYEGEDPESDVEAVGREVKGAIGNDPTDEADYGGQVKDNEK